MSVLLMSASNRLLELPNQAISVLREGDVYGLRTTVTVTTPQLIARQLQQPLVVRDENDGTLKSSNRFTQSRNAFDVEMIGGFV